MQAYAAAVALTGVLVAVLAARERNAMRAARDWQTRFEAAIGAHRLIAYEWEPATGRVAVTGDTAQLLGRAPAQIATLANWLALVASEDRERVAARFERRALSETAQDSLTYLVQRSDGVPLAVSDEGRPIVDHDGRCTHRRHRVASRRRRRGR